MFHCTEIMRLKQRFSIKTQKALDDFIERYCRWALGVPKMAKSLRAVYGCALTSRSCSSKGKIFSPSPVTPLGLSCNTCPPTTHQPKQRILQAHYYTTEPLSSAALVRRTASCLRKWGLLFANGLPSDPEYASLYVHHKKSLCNRVRRCSQNDWKNEILCI